jgi:hypothetical protein
MEDLNRRGVRSKVRVAKNGKPSAGTHSSGEPSTNCSRTPSTLARLVTREPATRGCTRR